MKQEQYKWDISNAEVEWRMGFASIWAPNQFLLKGPINNTRMSITWAFVDLETEKKGLKVKLWRKTMALKIIFGSKQSKKKYDDSQ